MPMVAGWDDRVPGPGRRTSEDPGLPGRAWRGRGDAGTKRMGASGGGGCERGWGRREAAGGLCDREGRISPGGAGRVAEGAVAGLYDTFLMGGAGSNAIAWKRKDQPAGVAGGCQAGGYVCGATDGAGAGVGRHLG